MKKMIAIINTMIRISSIAIFFALVYFSETEETSISWTCLYLFLTQVIIPGILYALFDTEHKSECDGELRISVADDEGTIWRLSIPDEVAKTIEEKDILTIKVVK